MSATSPFPVVPGLFARRSINLLIGSSGAGKTLLSRSQLNEYAESRGFLGYGTTLTGPIHAPEQIGIIACTQSETDLCQSVEGYSTISSQMRCPHQRMPKELNLAAFRDCYEMLTRTAQRNPVRFLLLEGIQHLLTSGKMNDPKSIRELCHELQDFCQERDVTILGTVGCAKMLKGNKYELLADKPYGGITWSQEMHTLIGIEELDPLDPNLTARQVTIRPRDARSSVLFVDFNKEGHLELVAPPEKIKRENQFRAGMNSLLEDSAQESFKKREFVDWGENLGASESAVERWIEIQLDMGFLIREGRTQSVVYRKPRAQ